MGAMKNLDLLLQELDSKADEIHQTVVDIRKMFTATEEETPTDDWEDYKREEQLSDAREEEKEQVKVETKKVLTLEEVRPILANLSRDGHTAEIKALLTKYGANKLSEINPDDYEALLNDAKELGNGC